jgi:hypothetical protein
MVAEPLYRLFSWELLEPRVWQAIIDNRTIEAAMLLKISSGPQNYRQRGTFCLCLLDVDLTLSPPMYVVLRTILCNMTGHLMLYNQSGMFNCLFVVGILHL